MMWRAIVLAPRLGRELARGVDSVAEDGILADERALRADVGHRGAVGVGPQVDLRRGHAGGEGAVSKAQGGGDSRLPDTCRRCPTNAIPQNCRATPQRHF